MAEKIKMNNYQQFYGFNGEAFCEGKTFRVVTDPEVDFNWDQEKKKPLDEAKAIKFVAEVWHDGTKYVDTKTGETLNIHNRNYPVTFKIKLPEGLIGKPKEDPEVQQVLNDCPLHIDDIFEVKQASYYYSSNGLYVTFEDKKDFNWLDHFTI